MSQAAPIRVNVKMTLPATVAKKGKWYVSSCPVLGVMSQGETEKKALENLVEALVLFLTSCYERGTLEKVLKQCGFRLENVTKKKPFVPGPLPKNMHSVDIPIPFLVERPAQGCHA